MLQTFIHYSLHFLAPILLAYLFFRKDWWKAYGIMIASMMVDADHLVANPIFDPNRCSIGYHPLHTLYAIVIYLLLLIFWKNKYARMLMVGLLFHMLTDFIDCLMLFSRCAPCYENFLQQLP